MSMCVWRKVPEQHDYLLTCKLDPESWTWATGGSSPSLSLGCALLPRFWLWEQLQGHSREGVGWRWDHLDDRPVAQLKPLYELPGFWLTHVEIYPSCGCLPPASQVSSFAYWNCHLLIWSDRLLSLVSLCPLCPGASFKFHLGSSQGFMPIIGELTRGTKTRVLGKRHLRGKFQAAHWLLFGEGSVYVRCLQTNMWVWICPQMPAGPMCLCEEQGSTYWGREGRAVAPT